MAAARDDRERDGDGREDEPAVPARTRRAERQRRAAVERASALVSERERQHCHSTKVGSRVMVAVSWDDVGVGGPSAFRALRDAIDTAKGGNALAPVTVVVPSS